LDIFNCTEVVITRGGGVRVTILLDLVICFIQIHIIDHDIGRERKKGMLWNRGAVWAPEVVFESVRQREASQGAF
jgi:hypothetical protein